MPKKSTAARSGTQRNRPRVQKSFEVVRQGAEEQVPGTDNDVEEATASVAPAPSVVPARSTTRTATKARVITPEVQEKRQAEKPVTSAPPAPKASTSTRSASSRLGQRSQLKSAATLVTAEHYSYVKRDLVLIAVLASCMFVAVIVLYFVLGRGI